MATNFSPCKGSYVLNQFPSNVMFGMNGFHISASGAIQGHHGPLVDMYDLLVNLYQLYSYDATGVKTGPTQGVTSWNNRNKEGRIVGK